MFNKLQGSYFLKLIKHFMFYQFSGSHTRLLGVSARFLGNEVVLLNFVAIQDLVCSS